MSLNKVMLIGNVGKDPEVRYLEGNTPNAKVASFTLATTERYRDRNGELRENTEWHNIVAWRNNADVIEKYVRKGTQLYIEGRIRTRSWDDQTGNKHYITEIQADNLQLLGKKADNPATQGVYNGGIGQQSLQQSAAQQTQPSFQTQGQGQWQNPAQQAQQTQQAQQSAAQQTQQAASQPKFDISDNPDDDLPF